MNGRGSDSSTRSNVVHISSAAYRNYTDSHVLASNEVFQINDLPANFSDTAATRVFANLHLGSQAHSPSFRALYDTGACVSLLSRHDFEAIRRRGLVKQSVPHNCTVLNASQKPMVIDGAFRCRIWLKGKPIPATFLVSPDVKHSIIGMNVIKAHKLFLDPVTMAIKFHSAALDAAPPLATADGSFPTPIAEFRVLRDTTIDPRTGKLTSIGLFDSNGRRIERDLELLADMDAMAVALHTTADGSAKIHFPNASHEPRLLRRGQLVGKAFHLHDWQPVDAADALRRANGIAQHKPLRPHTSSEKQVILEKLRTQVNSTVPYQFRDDYINMLYQREAFFSASSTDLGVTDEQQHGISLADATPVFSPQFRLPAEHLKLLQENVAGWLQAGIIERAKSPYNAPIFCVPKKHGQGMRAVLDYRRLNGKSVMDKYSIRTIDECIESIGRAKSKVFSALDLTNGYWQMLLKKSDRPYTAFTLPGKGQFQWVTTPQGLMGAPASFSRLMDLIMQDAENVITYIDDCLVHSQNHNDHLRHLASAIDRIGRCNLRLNPAKCIFGSSSVEYLGHSITSDGIRPGLDKAGAVRDAAPPQSLKELKSFIGLANYFRGYIHNFSLKAAPLFKLTRSDSHWKGGYLPDDAKNAFYTLRAEISSRPVMAYPRREGDFHLYVDASLGDSKTAGGLGAVLLQDQPGGLQRPVGYVSRRLAAHEQNYPSFLAEMQAAIYGMEQFHHYLVGRKFFLYTDHKPLCRLSTVHTKTLNRLQHKMNELYPIIKYVDGKNNQVADFLSRYHGFNVSNKTSSPEMQAESIAKISHRPHGLPLAQVDASPFRLRALQALDPKLSKIRQIVKQNCKNSTPLNPDSVRVDGRIFALFDGVLQVKVSHRQGIISTSPWRTAVPESMKQEILNEAHNSWLAGHGGIFKTTERLKADFWWPRMDSDIADHVSRCTTCQATTNKGELLSGPLQPLPQPTGPNRRVHADLFGPLKSSTAGNRYVLVLTDAFSKFAHATAIVKKDAVTVAQKLLQIFYTFGIPEVIQTDQGLEFCNVLQETLWDNLGIRHDVTSPYHPACNAGAETFNKSMKHYLATAILDSEQSTLDWELYLGPLMLSYNSAVSSTTKVSPFHATFGYDPRIPLWDNCPLPDLDGVKNLSFADYLAKLRHAQTTARQIVHHNNTKARQTFTDNYNKRRAADFPSFQPGDLVWARINDRTTPNQKLAPKWEPAIIVRRSSASTYVIKRPHRRRSSQITINVEHLKPRRSPLPPRATSPTFTSTDTSPSTSRDSSPAPSIPASQPQSDLDNDLQSDRDSAVSGHISRRDDHRTLRRRLRRLQSRSTSPSSSSSSSQRSRSPRSRPSRSPSPESVLNFPPTSPPAENSNDPGQHDPLLDADSQSDSPFHGFPSQPDRPSRRRRRHHSSGSSSCPDPPHRLCLQQGEKRSLSPRAADRTNPSRRLRIEEAYSALNNAEYLRRWLDGRSLSRRQWRLLIQWLSKGRVSPEFADPGYSVPAAQPRPPNTCPAKIPKRDFPPTSNRQNPVTNPISTPQPAKIDPPPPIRPPPGFPALPPPGNLPPGKSSLKRRLLQSLFNRRQRRVDSDAE